MGRRDESMKMIIRNDDVGYTQINDLGMFPLL